MLFKFSFIAFALFLNACGSKNSSNNDKITECPAALSQGLDNFLLQTSQIKTLANELKSDRDKYTLNELKRKLSVWNAENHCHSNDEIMSFTQEKCSYKGSEISIKDTQSQCDSYNQIMQKYLKFQTVDNDQKPSELTGDLKTQVSDCIDEIIKAAP